MIIPNTYIAALLLTFFTMLCWGSWANTIKLTGKWRFELFCYDYALGVLLCALLVAFTFGTMGDEITFMDNLTLVRKKQLAFGMAAGGVFNLANMLLVGAITIAGMAVAFPIGIGLALVIGTVWNYILKPQANPLMLFGGVVLIAAAIVITALAYRALQAERVAAAASRKPAKRSPAKGIVISLISGVLMGSFYPLVEMGKKGDFELSPYGIGLFFAIGIFLSTLVYNLYFVNLPLEGKPISIFDYFKGSLSQHLLGITGGIIWYGGTIANFLAASAPERVQVGPAVSYAIGQGATLVSTLWGLLVWKEFAGAGTRPRNLIVMTLLLYAIGLALISTAPLFAR